jgi:hypothetical protein
MVHPFPGVYPSPSRCPAFGVQYTAPSTTLRPIPRKDPGQPRIYQRVIHQQHHLAVELVADLTAVEAAHGRPRFAAYPHQHELGMDPATGGIAQSCVQVQPFRRGNRAHIVHSGPVAAQALGIIVEAVQPPPHPCATTGRSDQGLQPRVGIGDGVAGAIAPVLVVTINKPFGDSAPDSRCATPHSFGATHTSTYFSVYTIF